MTTRKPKVLPPDIIEALDKYLIRCAFHEAGHIVVGHHLGRRYTKAVINKPWIRRPDKAAAFVQSDGRQRAMSMLDGCTEAIGGFVAQGIATGEFCDIGASSDLKQIEHNLKRVESDPAQRELMLLQVKARAGQILAKRWSQVCTVADALMDHKTLNAKQIKTALERGEPKRAKKR